MFSTASVSEAISTAVQQQQAILIFISAEDEESARWEQHLLPKVENEVKALTVALKLLKGSEGALQFGQLFPVLELPAVYIIRDGNMKDFICSVGIEEESFRQRVLTAIGAESTLGSSNQQSTPNMQSQLDDRRRRLEKAREEKKQVYKKPAPANASNAAYAEENKAKLQVAKEERQRVLRLLEDDRAERKARQARRESSSSPAIPPIKPILHDRQPSNDTCALSIRLLDGSTIKQSFPMHTRISQVRTWVDENRSDGDRPFIFVKRFPTRSLGVGEEEETLLELELFPSAVLILKPALGAASAYESNTWSSLAWSVTGRIQATFKTFLGIGPDTPSAEPSSGDNEIGGNSAPAVRPPSRDARIRTFHSQKLTDDDEDSKFYNGNQLDTLPNTDAEDSQ